MATIVVGMRFAGNKELDGQLSREQVMLLYNSDFSELIKH